MLIRLIGPVTVVAGAEAVRITASKRACVLAVLAERPGAPVSHTELIYRVWDGAPPDAVTSALYSYVARLRAELKGTGASIERAGAFGYTLRVDPEDVDVHRMRALAARAAGLGGGPEALEAWRRACALAQGEALAGVGGRWARGFREAFERERAGILASRYAAELDAGRHEAVVDELAALVADAPLAEPLVARLMLALYRSGRAAEALGWFETTRVRLRDDLGADPSPELRDLHRRVLQHDDGLNPPPDVPARRPAAPGTLPADITGFVGRERHLDELTALSEKDATALVVGQAGAGKTALAVHWGQSRREWYPDGQLYINLRGFDRGETLTPRAALTRLLQALGAGRDVPQDVDAAAEMFRTRTTGRRMLLVLDNAAGAEQVRPLLPGSGCFTIVTSRNRMAGLVALNDARMINLDVLERAESLRLLRTMLGDSTVDADPAAADDLARLCGDLPLALRIAAARLSEDGDTAAYVRALEGTDRLALLAIEGDADATVTAALDASYTGLDDTARDLFRRLGAVPGEDASAELIEAVSGLPEEGARKALRRLVTGHLVEEYLPGRYRMHDLVRLYAAARAAELGEADRDGVVDAFIDWHNGKWLVPDVQDEVNVLAAADVLDGHPHVWRMLRRIGMALNHHRFLHAADAAVRREWRRCADRGDDKGVFAMANLAAMAAARTADTDTVIAASRVLVDLAQRLGTSEQITSLGNLGLRIVNRDHLEAAEYLTRAVELAVEAGDTRLYAIHGNSLVRIRSALGQFATARRHLAALEEADPGQPRFAYVCVVLLLEQHRFAEALAQSDRALAVAAEHGDRRHEAYTLMERSEALRGTGRPAEALAAVRRAQRLLEEQRMEIFEPEVQLAYTYAALGEPGRALDVIEAARERLPRVSELMDAGALKVSATAYLGLGRLAEARDHALRAAEAHGAMNARVRQVESLRLLADVLDAMGEHAKAADRREEAAGIIAGFEEGWLDG